MRLVPLLLVALLTPLTLPAHADGGGGDYPNRWQDALDVAPGTYEGQSDPRDKDWLRVTHPPGKAVRVTVVSTGSDVGLSLLDDAGASATTGHDASSHGNGSRLVYYGASPGGGIRAGIDVTFPGTAHYTMTLEVVDLPDMTVTGLHVRRAYVDTPQGPAEHPALRYVDVTFANAGGAAGQVAVGVSVSSDPGVGFFLGGFVADLDVGEARTATFCWDGAAAGEAVVRARAVVPAFARPGPELTHANDEMTITETFAASIPAGLILGPRVVSQPMPVAGCG